MSTRFEQTRLDNGLQVVTESWDAAYTSAIGFFVRAGARDETPEQMGVSHFLEHMMFKGTDKRSADDVNRAFDEAGANYNAYTSHEQTVYYAHVLPERLDEVTELFADMLRPSLRNEDFDVEKNVILEEIGMYDDRPDWRLHHELLEIYYSGHPLGFRVLGTAQTVSDLTADQMRDYFNQRYASDQIVVAAAGRIDHHRLSQNIQQLTEHWTPGHANGRQPASPACPGSTPRTLTDDQTTKHYSAFVCPAPGLEDERRYTAKILADILGDTEGSRLFWSLVDPGLADEADFSYDPNTDGGVYSAFIGCSVDDAERVESVLLETIRSAAEQLDDDELTRAKNKLATQATLQAERPSGRMHAIGSRWLTLASYSTARDELDRLMAVTRRDVLDLIDAFPLEPAAWVRMTPAAQRSR
ncbi:M16 family metallopeptidase [Mucisphaera calidilacus]|uniref:Protease 3 n=1 Tax=Mucisphaera calidilacus TaxID=2527982 RepID=A0A518BZY3_9BACT|nr:pitrilysin family protein [Mucisphaera calidilacus]QDU72534.1 Protease 3 precursor [Mucisphaera calidilacus]